MKDFFFLNSSLSLGLEKTYINISGSMWSNHSVAILPSNLMFIVIYILFLFFRIRGGGGGEKKKKKNFRGTDKKCNFFFFFFFLPGFF